MARLRCAFYDRTQPYAGKLILNPDSPEEAERMLAFKGHAQIPGETPKIDIVYRWWGNATHILEPRGLSDEVEVRLRFSHWTDREKPYAGQITIEAADAPSGEMLRRFKRHAGLDSPELSKIQPRYRWKQTFGPPPLPEGVVSHG